MTASRQWKLERQLRPRTRIHQLVCSKTRMRLCSSSTSSQIEAQDPTSVRPNAPRVDSHANPCAENLADTKRENMNEASRGDVENGARAMAGPL